jgi:hypothetical protein
MSGISYIEPVRRLDLRQAFATQSTTASIVEAPGARAKPKGIVANVRRPWSCRRFG